MLETHQFEHTMKFYTEILGFTIRGRWENNWAHLERDDVAIMFSIPNEHRNLPAAILSGSIYLRTENVDAAWEQLHDKAAICYPIENFDYGMREFAIYDNNGYILQFGQPIEDLNKC